MPEGVRREDGFRCLARDAALAFDVVGILASLAAPLARARIPIFALSTFDTDYLFVRQVDLARRGSRRCGAPGTAVSAGRCE